MKRVGITVDGLHLNESLATELRALNAEVFVVTAERDGRAVLRDASREPSFRELLAALDVSGAPPRACAALALHARRGAEVFVTGDLAAFGADGSRRRRALEELIGTPILSAGQFQQWAGSGTERRAA